MLARFSMLQTHMRFDILGTRLSPGDRVRRRAKRENSMVCNKTRPDEIAEALGREFTRHAALHDREASFPFENFDRITASGLAALTVPREYGGRGAGLFETCAVVGAIARGNASTALVLTMQ